MIQSFDFLNSFSRDKNYFLSLPFLWAVNIGGVEIQDINAVLGDAGERWQATAFPDQFTSRHGSLLVAQEVTIPNETSSFQALESGTSMGGYLPSYGLTSRSNFLERSFSVNFIETENDLEHQFFRPWMIAMGINGLIEDGTRLKGTMDVMQYNNRGQLRKGYRFNKVFPTAVEGFTLNYESSDFIIKSVTFACQNYEQL